VIVSGHCLVLSGHCLVWSGLVSGLLSGLAWSDVWFLSGSFKVWNSRLQLRSYSMLDWLSFLPWRNRLPTMHHKHLVVRMMHSRSRNRLPTMHQMQGLGRSTGLKLVRSLALLMALQMVRLMKLVRSLALLMALQMARLMKLVRSLALLMALQMARLMARLFEYSMSQPSPDRQSSRRTPCKTTSDRRR